MISIIIIITILIVFNAIRLNNTFNIFLLYKFISKINNKNNIFIFACVFIYNN